MRKANDRLLLDIIRKNPGISRSQLGRITGSASSSITLMINRLVQAGLLLEEPVTPRDRLGRRPKSVRLATDAMLAVGVDICQAGPRVGLVDLSARVLRQENVSWHDNPEILLRDIHSAIRTILDHAPPAHILGVGVSVPGSLETSTGRVIASVNLDWYDMDLGGRLRGELSLPYYYQNNANLCALAEQWFMPPEERALRDFVYVLAADGLGTGIIVNAHVLQGAFAIGGEFGHTVIYPEGRKCACGNHGCWEQYVSAKALSRIYCELAGATDGRPLPDTTGVVDLARRGDALALGALRQVASDLALGFLNVISVFDPEAIFVGGFLQEAWDLIEDTVWRILRSRAPHYALNRLRILPGRHGADSGLLGAAALVFLHYFTTFDSSADAEEKAVPVAMQVIG